MDKINRSSIDASVAEWLNKEMDARRLGNTRLADMTNGTVGYNRVRDIRHGLRGPIRLSEFVSLCSALDVEPASTLRAIIANASRMESERVAREEREKIEATLAQLRENPMTLAASHDPNKWREAQGDAYDG